MASIKKVDVNSSFIISMGYEAETLTIHMKSGIYNYNQVPEAVWRWVLASKSAGKAYNKHIKNKFECEKIF